jgi:hypothetical protein
LALIAAHGEVARVLVTDHSLAGERGAAVLHREQVALNGVLALNQGCTDATVHLIELRDAIDREESRPISSTH